MTLLLCVIASSFFAALKLYGAITWSWWWPVGALFLAAVIDYASTRHRRYSSDYIDRSSSGWTLWDWLIFDSLMDHHHGHCHDTPHVEDHSEPSGGCDFDFDFDLGGDDD